MRRTQRLFQPALGRSQLLGCTLPTLLACARAAHEESRETTDEDEDEYADVFEGRQLEYALPEHESVVDDEERQANGESDREIVAEQRGQKDRKDEHAWGQIEAPALRVLEDDRRHEHARGGNRERPQDAPDGEAAPHMVSLPRPRDAGSAPPVSVCIERRTIAHGPRRTGRASAHGARRGAHGRKIGIDQSDQMITRDPSPR